MKAVGDVDGFLAAENEHGTESLVLNRVDQVLHDTWVIERCRSQSGSA
jgi:hypothetical protein